MKVKDEKLIIEEIRHYIEENKQEVRKDKINKKLLQKDFQYLQNKISLNKN